MPVSYLTITARSLNQSASTRTYSVQLYFAINSLLLVDDSAQASEVDSECRRYQQSTGKTNLTIGDIFRRNPRPLEENWRYPRASWGSIRLVTESVASVNCQSGTDVEMMQQFIQHGKLSPNRGSVDQNETAIAFVHDLGQMGGPNGSSKSVHYTFAHIRIPAVVSQNEQGSLPSLWEAYFDRNADRMMLFAYEDRSDALTRATTLDAKIDHDCRSISNGSNSSSDAYREIVTYSLRQAFASFELVGTRQRPWAMFKDEWAGACQPPERLGY